MINNFAYFGIVLLIFAVGLETQFDKIKADPLYLAGQSFNRLWSLVLLLTFSFYFLYYFRSLFVKFIGDIGSRILKYGKTTFSKIHFPAKTKPRGGKEENSSAS
jgi:hypothetical protein